MRLLDLVRRLHRTEPARAIALDAAASTFHVGRRGFLTLLGAGTAALVLDPGALLWTPRPIVLVPSLEYRMVTAEWVAQEWMRLAKKNLNFITLMNRVYDRPPASPGVTTDVRLPERYRV